MKARLYRGPHDGRVLEVPNYQRTIKLKRRKQNVNLSRLNPMTSGNPSDGWLTIETVDDEYYMVLTRMPDGKLGFSVHPDGSVYFEWSKKRGSRIER
jgi:hypothetical protein